MTKTEIALLRWGQLPMFAAIVGWILGFVGVAAGMWRSQWYWVLYFIATVAMTALCIQQTNAARERYIREAPLPRFLQRKLREAYPQLSAKDGELVERGLRQFFLACLRSRQFVAMPSQAVDVLWHSSSCTRRPTNGGAPTRWAAFCTTPRPKPWGAKACTTTACGAPGSGRARRNPSTPRPPAACRCCLHWMPSSPSPTGSTTCPTAD